MSSGSYPSAPTPAPTGCCDICGTKFTLTSHVVRCKLTQLLFCGDCKPHVETAERFLDAAVRTKSMELRHPFEREYTTLGN